MHANTVIVAYLLDACNMSGDVFDGYRVFDCESMTLTLYPCFVDENSAVRGQAYGM